LCAYHLTDSKRIIFAGSSFVSAKIRSTEIREIRGQSL
jgi:hypothetical protein